MKAATWGALAVLALCVASSMASSPAPGEAALVLAAGAAAFWFLGRPWTLQPEHEPMSVGTALASAALLIIGRRSNFDVLIALGCLLLVADLLRRHLPNSDWPAVRNRLPLLLVAMPWLQTDAWLLGWVFRWSGAIVVENILGVFGMPIQRYGTTLYSGDIGLDVAPACAGLRSLQLLLLAGIIAVAMRRGGGLPHWVAPVVVGVSWVANTFRVLVLCLVATSFGVEQAAAGGTLHETVGTVIAGFGLIAIIAFCPVGTPTGAPAAAVKGATL
jgi:exosortase/archaeosortase family protein